MTDELTPARVEANLREVSLVLSRFAAVLVTDFGEMSRALYDARPAIGEIIYRKRRCVDLTREKFAARYNVPLDALVRIERWRLIKEPTE